MERQLPCRFPFPRSASLFYGRDASGLVGAWSGVRERGQQQHHANRTPHNPHGFSTSAAVSLRSLEPSARRAAAGETNTTADDRRRRTKNGQGPNKQTHKDNRTGDGQTTGTDNKRKQIKQRQTAAANKGRKLQHSKRQKQEKRRRRSEPGRDRH